MAGKDDDGLSLGLSLSLGSGKNAANNNDKNNQTLFPMHKPPQSTSNQRASFNNLFPFHGM